MYISSFHGIIENIKAKPLQAKLLLAQGKGAPRQGPRVRDILGLAKEGRIPVQGVETAHLDRIDPDHKGIVLEILGSQAEPRISLEDFLKAEKEKSLVLILDHIEDPQNFGAILRSADAFGADLVIAPLRRASPMSESVAKASAGAAAWVPICFVQNLADAVRKLKSAGYWIYAADMEGKPLGKVDFAPKSCFVLGNEGSGVSRLLAENADETVSIPMRGHVGSLNVSVASALCMYEYARRYS
ncbi:MAG: 23S rRNA (guanosine2251-2'-O)-methyltransferase [Spirochaetes bacterium]|nr:MAG: 23S rRNA (guanosine2251-2'-O)-methyltransferase [Spirochaetota bacterium]